MTANNLNLRIVISILSYVKSLVITASKLFIKNNKIEDKVHNIVIEYTSTFNPIEYFLLFNKPKK